MSIKKINGYKVFLQDRLGKGSFGAVPPFLHRSTRDSQTKSMSPVRSRSSTKRTLTPTPTSKVPSFPKSKS